MSLKGDVTFHTALVSGVSHAFHVCLQPSYQGQKNEIKPFCSDVTLETELHIHPFYDPQMFILQVTKVDSLNYSVLFGMKIPTVLTLKFPQVQIAFIFRYLNIEIPWFLSLSAYLVSCMVCG